MRIAKINGLSYHILDNDQIIKRRGKGVIKAFPDKDGYLKYAFTSKFGTYNIAVHKFVQELYNGPVPNRFTIDHKDNDRSNNHISNLQLLTPEENAIKGNARYWMITNPDGIEFKIYNLRKFCREHKLHRSHLYEVANGKLKQYKGWTCYELN